MAERTFPRHGKKPAIDFVKCHNKLKEKDGKKLKKNQLCAEINRDINLKEKRPRSFPKNGKKPNVTEDYDSYLENALDMKYVQDLKISMVRTDMTVLGCVNEVSTKAIYMSLPGHLRGNVYLANVSDEYSKLLMGSTDSEVPTLPEMFKHGQFLPVKILQTSDRSKFTYFVSIKPQDINGQMPHSCVVEGMILSGAVQSKEDHGYVINFGIPQLQAFLNFDKVPENTELSVGQVLRLAVLEVKQAASSCTASVSAIPEDVLKAHLPQTTSLAMQNLVPGLQFTVTIKSEVKHGLRVQYGGKPEQIGYIFKDHLPPATKPAKKKAKKQLCALIPNCILLYVKPFIVVPFFKVLNLDQRHPFKFGDIVSGTVAECDRSGHLMAVVGQKENQARCLVPISKLPNGDRVYSEKIPLGNLYPVGRELQVRLGVFDVMGGYYSGDCLTSALAEKTFSMGDLSCGQLVDCVVTNVTGKYAKVKIGKGFARGHVDVLHWPDKPSTKLKINQNIKGRVLEVKEETRLVSITLKQSLVESRAAILSSYEEAKPNECYLGVIVQIYFTGMLVTFFNGVKGMVAKKHTTCSRETNLSDAFHVGQTVKCYVVEYKNSKLELSLLALEDVAAPDLKPGRKYSAVVSATDPTGLTLSVSYAKGKKQCTGFLPKELMTDHLSLASAMLSCYSVEQELQAYCVFTSGALNVFTTADHLSQFYKGFSKKALKREVQKGELWPFLVKYVDAAAQTLGVYPGCGSQLQSWKVLVPAGRITEKANIKKLGLVKFQPLMGKILSNTPAGCEISTMLSDVWDKSLEGSLELLNSYIKAVRSIQEKLYPNQPRWAEAVEGMVSTNAFEPLIKLTDGTWATAAGELPVDGSLLSGRVVWYDVHLAVPVVATDKLSVLDIAEDQGRNVILKSKSIHARVVYISKEVIIVALKGQGEGRLAFMPTKRHLNDLECVPSCYTLGEVISVGVFRYPPNNLLAIDRKVILMKEKQQTTVEAERKRIEIGAKRKRELSVRGTSEEENLSLPDVNGSEVEILNESIVNVSPIKMEKIERFSDEEEKPAEENDMEEEEDVEIKSEQESDIEMTDEGGNQERIDISSSEEEDAEDLGHLKKDDPKMKTTDVGFNWDVLNNGSLLSELLTGKPEDSSSDEMEEESSNTEKKKKQRLTVAERRMRAAEEEERLRRTEHELMATERTPQSADDFDRLLASKPDESALWLQYMAFHLQGTDIEKARAVARRALRTISFREEMEKLNVWLSLLNLEDMYGTEESLQDTVKEAVQCNDPYAVESHLLSTMYAQSKRLTEMERLGTAMLRKYKDSNPEVWWLVGGAYMKSSKVEAARAVLQRGLTSLDKSRHVELISKFAQLENLYGSSERAQTLYENILSAFPKRVDVWSVYVDMLVKSKNVDLARQVLERATSQRLPPKKMKILFKKFLWLEEKFGTEVSVEAVRKSAEDYVNNYVDD